MVGGRLQDVRIGTWEWWAVDACVFMAGGPLAGREAVGSPPASSLLLCFFLFPFVVHSLRGCWGLWVSWRRLGELPALNNLAWDPCHALGICSLPPKAPLSLGMPGRTCCGQRHTCLTNYSPQPNFAFTLPIAHACFTHSTCIRTIIVPQCMPQHRGRDGKYASTPSARASAQSLPCSATCGVPSKQQSICIPHRDHEHELECKHIICKGGWPNPTFQCTFSHVQDKSKIIC